MSTPLGSTIGAYIDALVAAQEKLVATVEVDPDGTTRDFGSIKAYPYTPMPGHAIAVPCFLNTYNLIRVELQGGGARELHYEVTSQFLGGEISEVQAEIVNTIHALYIDMIRSADADNQGGLAMKTAAGVATAKWQQLRGGTPTLAVLQWGTESYLGFQMIQDVQLHDNLAMPT